MSFSSIAIWFLWAALCYAVVGLTVLIIQSLRSPKAEPKIFESKAWLECLLKNGYDGESLLFRDKQMRRFIRFQKYIDSNGGAGLALTFPKIGWGKEFLPKLREYCENKSLAFSASEEKEPDYAHVEVVSDINEAFALCEMIWTRLFDFHEHVAFFCETGDLSNINELMDVAARSTLSDAEARERFTRYMNARLKHVGLQWLRPTSFLGVMGFGGLVLLSAVVFLVALVGLPVSTLMTLGDPHGWQLELGAVRLQGSMMSLFFFVVYLLSFEVLRRCMRFQTIDRRKMTRIEKIVHAPKRPLAFAIPIAVVLLWSGI